MSSHAPTVETGVSDGAVTAGGTDTTTTARSQFDVERQILCRRIRELERELARERQRRKQVVDRYERLLERRDREIENGGGLLDGLF